MPPQLHLNMMADAFLALENGDVLQARSRSPGSAHGELVFTTSYCGYEESLTDPSYEEQVLTFTYPLIGNYGVNPNRFESNRVHPNAVIARQLTDSISNWLHTESIPAIDTLDTRELVLAIRNFGAMRCGIAAGKNATPEDAISELDKCPLMGEHSNIGSQVSVPQTVVHPNNGHRVSLIDCGVKKSITDSFLSRNVNLTILPYNAPIDDVIDTSPDLLFISNGPGNPENFTDAISLVNTLAGELPIAGICLGQQIIALSLEGEVEKMSFGHRGANQPVLDLSTNKVVMTTQNHGYMVSEPGELEISQINVNDGTSEGLSNNNLSIITRQYHPEAHPGPHDTLNFFDDVLSLI